MTVKTARQVFLLIPFTLWLAGCTHLKQQGHCILSGGTGGLILGAMENAGTAAAGGAALAILSGLLCHQAEAETDNTQPCKGVQIGRNTCLPDSDQDGVPNKQDLCPHTPTNTSVDANGCPDTDRDGIVDKTDECPETVHGQRVDERGCPIIHIKPIGQIHFKFDQSTLSEKAKLYLDGIADQLKANPRTKLRAFGHTDISGPLEHNEKLCLRRAKSVTDYLIGQGVRPEQVEPFRGGIIREHNETREGRAKNRKVELNTEEE